MNDLITNNIVEKMSFIPNTAEIGSASKEARLLQLHNFNKLFIPKMSNAVTVYNTLYLACKQSIDRKCNPSDYKGINSVMSSSILGLPGVGKTSLINTSISLIGNEPILIDTKEEKSQIIPFLYVETPVTSIRSLLLLICEKADEILGTSYSKMANSKKMTIDQLINLVCDHLCRNYISVVILDEIDRLMSFKANNTMQLVNTLVSISNNGSSVIFAGTTEAETILQTTPYLGRRTLPKYIESFDFNEEFENLAYKMLSCNYAPLDISINKALFLWLYNHSGNGNPSILQSLIYKAYETAILTDQNITMDLLKETYLTMRTIHNFTTETVEYRPKKAKKGETGSASKTVINTDLSDFDLVGIVNKCKRDEKLDIWSLLSERVRVIRI